MYVQRATALLVYVRGLSSATADRDFCGKTAAGREKYEIMAYAAAMAHPRDFTMCVIVTFPLEFERAIVSSSFAEIMVVEERKLG